MEHNGKSKILVVDDEDDVLRVVSKRLEKAGYDVSTASGGKQALVVLEKEIPELILLDIGMPDIDGIEVCNKIKKNKFISDIPVIFFTARDSIDDKIKGLGIGVHDYITKPVDHRELLARIDAVLKISSHYNEISLKDNLTGLYNYSFFEKHFTYIFNVAVRYKRVFSLIIADIDNFKSINDTYGHLCGNYVLKNVSERLKNSLRKVDIIARYGGDEFAIVLPEIDCKQAAVVLEKLKNAAGKLWITYKDYKVKVELSFGSSSYSEDIRTKEALFNIADNNMYRNKRRPRKSNSG